MAEAGDTKANEKLDHVVDVVSAFVANNKISSAELLSLIASVNKAFTDLSKAPVEPTPVKIQPAISIRRSITDDYIVCLEDGLKFKSLKRHLRAKYGMSPDEYRKKWDLPFDYPMVCPNYSAARSAFAKKTGLGQARRIAVQKKKAVKKPNAKKSPARAKAE